MISSNDKAAISTTKVIADLTMNGYNVYVPMGEYNNPFDLLIHKEKQILKIEVKYLSCNRPVPKETLLYTPKGSDTKKKAYKTGDFDYFAIYLAEVDKIIYPSITFKGKIIRSTVPNASTKFYWYEDFFTFTDIATKTTRASLGFAPYKRKRKTT